MVLVWIIVIMLIYGFITEKTTIEGRHFPQSADLPRHCARLSESK